MNALISSADHFTGGLWPYLVVILFGFLPSEIWRWAAVFLGRSISEESEVLVWVKAVASALLAGVVAKLLLTPAGALASVPILWRGAALLIGVGAFYFSRKSVLIGMLVGEAVLVSAALMAAG